MEFPEYAIKELDRKRISSCHKTFLETACLKMSDVIKFTQCQDK